jgi:hypothetical protein
MLNKKILAASMSAIVHFNDEATVLQMNDFAVDMPSERMFKDSGAMVAPCTIARTGIMQYRASECGAMFADRNPNDIINIATLEADLFDADSIESYRSCPITVNHPVEWVNTTNAKDLQKGNLDSIPVADSNLLTGHIVITDADTLKLIDSGISQLSSGTSCVLVMADKGLEYDAYKTNIRANHIALVESGRNGNAQIADEDIELSDAEVKLVDAEAKLVDALAQVTQMTTDAEVSSAKLDDALAKLATSDKAVADAELKVTDAAIEALVASRLLFVQEVATLSDMDITGKSTIESKRAVMAELRDTDLTEKSDTYIEALFDIALADSDTESPMTNLLRKQVNVEINDKVVEPISKATTARENAIKRTQGK